MKNNSLNRCLLFSNLLDDEISEALAAIFYSVKEYPKNAVIVTRGDNCDELQIVLNGMVKAEMLDHNGKVVEIATLKTASTIAPAFLFGSKNKYPVNVVSISEVTLLIIPKISLLELIKKNEKILTNYLNMISSKVQYLTERIWTLSFNTIKEKFAQYLLKLGESGLDKIKLDKTQLELSEYFGVSRPSLARIISEMQKDGIIEINKKVVTIKNKKQLLNILNNK